MTSQELGGLQLEIRPRVVAGIFLAGSGFCVLAGGVALFAGTRPGGDGSLIGGAIGMAFASLALAVGGIVIGRRRLQVFEHGLVVRGFPERTLRFDDIVAIEIPGPEMAADDPLARLRFREGTGRKVSLTGFYLLKDAREATSLILSRVVPRLVREASARLRSGESVRFGTVEATVEGVVARGATLPWSRISAIHLTAYGRWGFFTEPGVPALEIPLRTTNVHVLVELCRARAGVPIG